MKIFFGNKSPRAPKTKQSRKNIRILNTATRAASTE